jgi:hypothetical protein
VITGRLREAAGLILALVVATVAAVSVTWPMAQHMDTAVMGGGELGGWLWRYDWHFRSLDALVLTDLDVASKWRAFVSLGRYPETGNVLDVLAVSYPLERWFGFPLSYNLKILIIMVGDGVCGYALGRYMSGSIAGALVGCAVAVVNPITVGEIQASGLRQAILWWVLLYPALLDRALRRRTLGAGFLAGACWGLAAAYYWFYGLFTLIFTGLWLAKHVVIERARLAAGGMVRAALGMAAGLGALAGPFVIAYVLSDTGANKNSASAQNALPEMTFFLPFPAYDTIVNSPLRPQTYAENVLASIHRTIGSSWSLTFPFDPALNEALPLAVFWLGVLPAVGRRRAWGWLGVWLVFAAGTLGPFLRIGKGDAEDVTVLFDQFVVRLPYTLMFQFVPGMSRMFAPYRLGSYVVVASVALVALGIARFRFRALAAPVLIAATVLQPMYRWNRGAVNEGASDSREFRSPLKANRIIVPEFYKSLDPTELTGILELPLEQQQDLVCYYQILHQQKVYHSWASPSAVPPPLRKEGTGGDVGSHLRFQARADVINGPVPDAWQALSRTPDTADLSVLEGPKLADWARTGNYRLAIVHERGYYLVDPTRGRELYQAALRRLVEAWGAQPEEFDEIRRGDPARPEFGVPADGDLLPWTSQPLVLPAEQAVPIFHMAVFRMPLPAEGTPPSLEPSAAPAEGGEPPPGTAPEREPQ